MYYNNFGERRLSMLMDFYELTMANGYFSNGMKDEIVYFDLFFCSGLQVRVLTYTDSRYSQHLGDIRKLFINAIGHSYLPLYESELKIGDSVIRLTEKKIDD